MSSNEGEYSAGDTSSGVLQKKPRILRACDICRRRKIRCDGVQMPGKPCSNCVSSRFDCTYVEAAKKRVPLKGHAEMGRKLERLERLERLLRQLFPDEVYNQLNASLDSNWTIGEPPVDPSALVSGIASKAQPNAPTLEKVNSAIRSAMEDSSDAAGSDDDDPTLILAENLKRMALPTNDQFFGKSSGAMLLSTAFELRNEYKGEKGRSAASVKPAVQTKRTEFWDTKPWECQFEPTTSPKIKYKFPNLDLALHCIDLYFLHSNLYLPLLHRPTFDKCVKEGLHLTNDNFAPVFLLVCAVGARYSDDPRVRLHGVKSHHSAGWKWFEQVKIMKRSPFAPPTLYDLQLYCLCILYLQGSSTPQSCWTLAGIGIRLAQDVGVHRRKAPGHTLTIEDELWKRAFWVLVCNDRIFSFSLGRACAIQDEDFDLDLPVDCDDEYWDHPDPEKCFKQPPDKPSSITSFILYIKLQQVLAFSLRTIYSINKSKILLGFVGPQWEQHIVAELDSALNKWVDSVPDHLRWDPKREDTTFFNQSVLLYATYYHLQILVHRPFIPSPSNPSLLSFPSLAICTNAARSCSHVIDTHTTRNRKSLILIQMPVFTSGIVLLFSIWGGKSSGLFMDPDKEMVDVHKCMKALKASECRLPTAGRLWDVLYELACVGELPLPQASPPSGTKRDRESDSPLSTGASMLASTLVSQNETSGAGTRRVREEPLYIPQPRQPQANFPSHYQFQTAAPTSTTSTSYMTLPHSSQTREIPELGKSVSTVSILTNTDPPAFALPVYSDELGRLPLHGQMSFTAQAHLSRPQTYTSPPDPQTNYCYTIPGTASTQVHERFEPAALGGTSGTSSSYPQFPPPLVPHQQRSHPTPQDISMGGLSNMTSTAHGAVADDIFDSTFSAHAHLSQSQTHTSQPDLEASYRDKVAAPAPVFHAYAGGPSSSYGPQYPPAMTHQQEPSSSRHPGVPMLPSVSDASSQGPYRNDVGELTTGMLFDAMGGYTSTYGLGPTHSALPIRSSRAPTPPHLSSGFSGGHYQHEHQTVPRQREHQASSYPFVLDNDAVGTWPNAPIGFELNNFLSKFGGLTQGNAQGHSGGRYQHQHRRAPQQDEQQSFRFL